MAVNAAEQESQLIDTLREWARERLPHGEAAMFEAFIRQYYHWLPAEDLAARDPEDMFGAALAHWRLATKREPGHANVRVYNPDRERDGWRSPQTVVEIVTDDMPFIVDSVTMELSRRAGAINLVIHPVMRVHRNRAGELIEVLELGEHGDGADGTLSESVLRAEVAREPDQERLDELREYVKSVLKEVRATVEDWKALRVRTLELVDELQREPPPTSANEADEAKAFLRWLADDHFTYMGYREYDLVEEEAEAGLQAVPGSGLGILRGSPRREYTPLRPKALEWARSQQVLLLTKANSRSRVHRPSYLDYIGVKRFNADGEVVGERRFLGLYTTSAYRASPTEIPTLRGKLEAVLERAGFPPHSHDAKGLLDFLEAYPRDELFQVSTDELFEITMGVLGLGERQRVRLFVRRDPLDRFVSCLVTIPRDRYNTENRERVGRILLEAFGGSHVDWSSQVSESVLARVYYIVHTTLGTHVDADVARLEQQLAEVTRAWSDDLRAALVDRYGEERGLRLTRRYAMAFPLSYRSDWTAVAAVDDVERIERLLAGDSPQIELYRPKQVQSGMIRCKLYSSRSVSLSDVLPTFEHMGAKVVDERPYQITPPDYEPAWIYDFGLTCVAEDFEKVRDLFHDAFLGVWRGDFEDDGLNGLVLTAAVPPREVGIVRAIAKYLRQAGMPYSNAYVERTALRHHGIARTLVELFMARLDPDGRDEERAERLARQIEESIDAVQSLDEDRILRNFLTVVLAILRTSYFRTDSLPGAEDDKSDDQLADIGTGSEDGNGGEIGTGRGGRPYLSFKLDPAKIPMLPQPRPQFEIFVYSPRFEGVHLRGGRVARGGIRWSDRLEDFRTEVLGLMKAQMVKNALIVPVGSKGGFVVKHPPVEGGREALQAEAIACYEMFLCGLLDLTDNYAGANVVAPPRVVRYDPDDPYLVVAADKGTATFSDIANEISARYGFWLGDAFASGGSQGYDHKQMGITARGAWESVKRHFRELGSDVQSTDFTAVGIGDMSGDVFGNGMLLSEHTKLIGAFNHMHVFLDPEPDPSVSFAERKRLFELPRSSWADYDAKLISEGGGVFSRDRKSIPISPQVKDALAIEADELAPTELIQQLLRAPVDLLWNGGIGTYVKASTEVHADAGDKANDALRVDGRDLSCKVVGEGGNLGLTQRGRIEYALKGGPQQKGGRINTDAIDNVAGVNTSDHEVNIKILLDSLVHAGEMSDEDRNALLREMTDSVGERVLRGSYTQTQAMSLALAQAPPMVDVHRRLIRYLEQTAGLKRRLEFLPDEETIAERKAAHLGLVAPELAVVLAHCKINLYTQLLSSDVPEDPFLASELEHYFPSPLPERYGDSMRSHRLRREIIATVVANEIVDRAGTTFVFRLREETGVSLPVLARAYTVARGVFDMRACWAAVERLDNHVEAKVQLDMLIEGRRLVERSARWLVSDSPQEIDVARTIEHFEPGAGALQRALPDVLQGHDRQAFADRAQQLRAHGVPEFLALQVAAMPQLPSVFDIVKAAERTGRPIESVMAVYFAVGARLELDWLRDRVIELPRGNRWQSLARAALRDELYSLHREVTQEVLEATPSGTDSEAAIESWVQENAGAVERCLGMIGDIKASRVYDTTTLPVALREVANLIRGGGSADGFSGDGALAAVGAQSPASVTAVTP